MVGGAGLGLDLAEELGRLAPFGMGNPGVRLLVPSARVRRRADDGGRQARPLQPPQRIATGRSASPSAARRWGSGRTIRSTRRCGSRSTTGTARSSRGSCCASCIRWRRRLRRCAEAGGVVAVASSGAAMPTRASRQRTARERGAGAVRRYAAQLAAASIAELVSSGAEVLAVCADAARRADRRPGAAARLGRQPLASAVAESRWTARAPRRLPTTRPWSGRRAWCENSPTSSSSIRRPPHTGSAWRAARSTAGTKRRALRLPPRSLGRGASGASRWRPCEAQLARRPALIEVFRDLREAGEASGDGLLEALRGERRRTRAARRPPPAASGCSTSSGWCRGRRTAVAAPSGSYPQRKRNWSARPRIWPTAPLPGGPAIPRTTQTSPSAARAPRRPLRRGRGVRLSA